MAERAFNLVYKSSSILTYYEKTLYYSYYTFIQPSIHDAFRFQQLIFMELHTIELVAGLRPPRVPGCLISKITNRNPGSLLQVMRLLLPRSVGISLAFNTDTESQNTDHGSS